MGSNHRPHAYQACALACWAISPYLFCRLRLRVPFPLLVEMRRIELLTPCLQGRCSPSWATPPYWVFSYQLPVLSLDDFPPENFLFDSILYTVYCLLFTRRVSSYQLPVFSYQSWWFSFRKIFIFDSLLSTDFCLLFWKHSSYQFSVVSYQSWWFSFRKIFIFDYLLYTVYCLLLRLSKLNSVKVRPKSLDILSVLSP